MTGAREQHSNLCFLFCENTVDADVMLLIKIMSREVWVFRYFFSVDCSLNKTGLYILK